MKNKLFNLFMVFAFCLAVSGYAEETETAKEQSEIITKDEGCGKYYDMASDAIITMGKFADSKFNSTNYNLASGESGLTETDAADVDTATEANVCTADEDQEIAEDFMKDVLKFIANCVADGVAEGSGDAVASVVGLCVAAESVDIAENICNLAFAVFSIIMLEDINWFEPSVRKIKFPINTIINNQSNDYSFYVTSYKILPGQKVKGKTQTGKPLHTIIKPGNAHLFSYITNYNGHDNKLSEPATIKPRYVPFFVRPIINNILLPMSIMYTGTWEYGSDNIPNYNSDVAFPLYGGLPDNQINFFSGTHISYQTQYSEVNQQCEAINNPWFTNNNLDLCTISSYSDNPKVLTHGRIQYDIDVPTLPQITMWEIIVDLSKFDYSKTVVDAGVTTSESFFNLYLYNAAKPEPLSNGNQFFLFAAPNNNITADQPSPGMLSLNILPSNVFIPLYTYADNGYMTFYLAMVNSDNDNDPPYTPVIVGQMGNKGNFSTPSEPDGGAIITDQFIIPLNLDWTKGSMPWSNSEFQMNLLDKPFFVTPSGDLTDNIPDTTVYNLYQNLMNSGGTSDSYSSFDIVSPDYNITTTSGNISGTLIEDYESNNSNQYTYTITISPNQNNTPAKSSSSSSQSNPIKDIPSLNNEMSITTNKNVTLPPVNNKNSSVSTATKKNDPTKAKSSSSSTPTQTINNTPASSSSSTPSQTINNTPASSSSNTPSQTINNTPASSSSSTPSQTINNTPASSSSSTPSQTINNTPASSSSSNSQSQIINNSTAIDNTSASQQIINNAVNSTGTENDNEGSI